MAACSLGEGEAAGGGAVAGLRVHDSCAVIKTAISNEVERRLKLRAWSEK